MLQDLDGLDESSRMVACVVCGREVREGARFCRYCGVPLRGPSTQDAVQSPMMVVVRCRRTREPFVINFREKRPGKWVGSTGIKLDEKRALSEAKRLTIHGDIRLDEYSCPCCGADTIAGCPICLKISCYSTGFLHSPKLVCGWCGRSTEPSSGSGEFGSLSGVSDI